MKLKNKTRLNETELKMVLDFHNASHDLLLSMSDGFTCSLEELSKLQTLTYRVRNLFNFKPQACEHGNPQHWGEYVLPNASNAWLSPYEIEQMQEKETVQ